MTIKELRDIITWAGYFVESYSGRSMYGTRCVSFTVDNDTGIFRAIADLYDETVNSADNNDHAVERVDQLSDLLRGAKYDTIGLDLVIYFPNVVWE